ncbi:MAG: hypothetical protein CM1200mP34_4370 [Verrucomicrobiales bacterium]|nr:MAG: hypothetical protein CM1200mP34_4370 [Verrucomicrobiales bacterium]
MITEADWANWTPGDLQPYVEAALEHFGQAVHVRLRLAGL